MPTRGETACALGLAFSGAVALRSLPFAVAPGTATASRAAVAQPIAPVAPSTATSGASSVAVVGSVVAAAAVVAAGLRPAQRQQKGRMVRVAAKALGSIDQFKVFGPKEDPFEIETDKVLGVGGQGTVYRCFRKSNPGKSYACKAIPIWRLLMDPSSKEKIAAIEKEVDVLLRVQGHPNVTECIGCYDAFRPGTSEPQYKMMVMELIQGGELAAFVREKNGLDEAVARSVVKQTCAGLNFIHGKQVLHRDLKCENILVCSETLTPDTQVKLIDFGVAKAVANTFARSCVGTTEIMAPELVCAKMMIAPKGVMMPTHGPFKFQSPAEASPGFGIVSQRPDGKGAMVNGIEQGGQAEKFGVGDGWAITKINGIEISEKPFIKDFNEIGAGTKAGVTAIAEMLGSLDGPFTMDFVELPKREFTTAVDLWSLGVVLYTMLAGKTPFKDETQIANGAYLEDQIKNASPEAKDLISKLLVLNPAQRLTLDQVLAHPWVTKA